jgi:hypothetical protein
MREPALRGWGEFSSARAAPSRILVLTRRSLPCLGSVLRLKPSAGLITLELFNELRTPKQAFAAREAHEALLELKKLVDDAAKITHAAELESFRAAINRDQNNGVRRSLRDVIERLRSPDFERVVLVVRERWRRPSLSNTMYAN